MLTRKKVKTTLVLVFGIVILLNIIADRFYLRLDFTEDQRYTLSEATKDILYSLEDPVTIQAYFSEDLPPDVGKVKQDFQDLLTEYSNYSSGQVVYEFINPNESQETEVKAQQSGIRPIMINVRERDQVKQQRAYLGAIVQLGDRTEIIPYIQPGAAMEFALSSAIKKISIVDKPGLAILQGNGEPGLNEMPQLLEALSVMYNVSPIDFDSTLGVPAGINTLLIIAPSDTMESINFAYLDAFLERGGNLLMAINRVDRNLENGMGESLYTGLSDWLKDKGIEIEENFIVDINCTTVMVRQQQGQFTFNTPLRFPYIPVINNFTEHPITEGLESIIFPFVSPIKITGVDTSVTVIPLALTSEKTGTQKPPVYFDVSKQWGATDFLTGNLPVAVALEGNINKQNFSKLVLFGDGDFVVNGAGQNAQQVSPDNINIMVNSIDWLADDTGLIELRTKGVTSRPLNSQLEDGTKTLIKYVNFLAPMILIILYGVYRFQVRRKIKNNLMTIDYV